MREIVHISAGQCGNQIGSAFWDVISDEHGIDEHGRLHKERACSAMADGSQVNNRLDVFYAETADQRYVPRAVFVDLEPATLNAIRSSPRGGLYRPDNMLNAQSSAGNNWAKGYYTEGSQIINDVLDAIRREVENTDSFQGFQLTHSLGGGTGSGLGTCLVEQLHESYPDKVTATYSVFPSIDSDTVVEPYNAVLSLERLAESSTETFCLDNHALYKIFQNVLKKPQPEHSDLNELIAKAMAGVTTTLRYPGQLNSDLRKLAVNLVPQSRLHFFTVGYAPLLSSGSSNFSNFGVQELTKQALDGRSFLNGVDPTLGKYLTCAAFYRGKASVKEIEDVMGRFRDTHADQFVEYIPDNLQTSLCPVPARGVETAATFVTNTTAVSQLFARIQEQFMKMYSRQAFVHWYEVDGLGRDEFDSAAESLHDLITYYEDAQNPAPMAETDEAIDYSQEDQYAQAYESRGFDSAPYEAQMVE